MLSQPISRNKKLRFQKEPDQAVLLTREVGNIPKPALPSQLPSDWLSPTSRNIHTYSGGTVRESHPVLYSLSIQDRLQST